MVDPDHVCIADCDCIAAPDVLRIDIHDENVSKGHQSALPWNKIIGREFC